MADEQNLPMNDDQMFSQLSNQVTEILQENNQTNLEFPVVYPSIGSLDLKLFYNPATPGIFWKEITRHQFDDKRFPCLSIFGLPCNFCQSWTERSSLWNGSDRNIKRTFYYLYAVVMKVNFRDPAGEGYKHPEPGDVIALMLPKWAFLKLSNLLGDAIKAAKIFKPKGMPIRVINSPEIEFNYDVQALEDEEVDISKTIADWKDKLIDLREIIYPSKPTQKILAMVEQKTNEFNGIVDNIARRLSSGGQNIQTGTPVFQPTTAPVTPAAVPSGAPLPAGAPQPAQPVAAPATVAKPSPAAGTPPAPSVAETQSTETGKPECFGKYDRNSQKCLKCFEEEDCLPASNK